MATTQTAPKKKGLINFDFLQKLGKVLMTVIAVMPAAGLMISLGKLVQMGGGDIAAVMTIGTTMENIGWAVINNLHMILDYDIILGGYVGSFLTPWLDTIRHLVAERNTFEDDGSFVKLCTYQTGAAAYGAAMDVMEEFLRTV